MNGALKWWLFGVGALFCGYYLTKYAFIGVSKSFLLIQPFLTVPTLLIGAGIILGTIGLAYGLRKLYRAVFVPRDPVVDFERIIEDLELGRWRDVSAPVPPIRPIELPPIRPIELPRVRPIEFPRIEIDHRLPFLFDRHDAFRDPPLPPDFGFYPELHSDAPRHPVLPKTNPNQDKLKQYEYDVEELPEEFLDPITYEIMNNPVTAFTITQTKGRTPKEIKTEHIFDRAVFDTLKGECPFDRQRFAKYPDGRIFKENTILKDQIETLIANAKIAFDEKKKGKKARPA